MHRCGCRRQIVDARGENSRQPPPPQTDRRRNRSGAGSERPAGDSSAFMNRNDRRPFACLSVCLSVCLSSCPARSCRLELVAALSSSWSLSRSIPRQGCSGAGTRGTASPTSFLGLHPGSPLTHASPCPRTYPRFLHSGGRLTFFGHLARTDENADARSSSRELKPTTEAAAHTLDEEHS